MAKKQTRNRDLRPLRIPVDFDEAVKALLNTPPPPKGTPGSRSATKTKKRKAKKR